MACATLKRSLDWESLNQRPTKRRRCNVYPTAGASTQSSSALSGNTKSVSEPVASVFSDATLTKLTPGMHWLFSKFNTSTWLAHSFPFNAEKMAQNIRDEITRLNRRKQLNFTYNCERMQDSESSGSEMGPDSPRRPDTPPNLSRNPEKGLFTFKQVMKQSKYKAIPFVPLQSLRVPPF